MSLLPAVADHAGAIAYAYRRLREELPSHLHYHDATHTIDDVVPAVLRLARLAHLAEADVRMLEVAAAFHDLGHIAIYDGHEDVSIAIMATVLPGFGFDALAVARLTAMINATRMPQTPRNREQMIFADADLDSLGRDDFLATSMALRKEMAVRGRQMSWAEWLRSQMQFLSAHRYFTAEARALRDAGKATNLRLLERLCDEAEQGGGAPD